MFQGIRTKLNDMSTIKLLCERAEAHALLDQLQEPGAEHFLLAALDLPDGTARLAFEQAGADPDALRAAIERQYVDALGLIGLKVDLPAETPMSANAGLYRASSSGREIMRELAATRAGHGPLLGAHVVGVVAGMSHGVASRALRAMSVDPVTLKSAADALTRAGRA